MEVMDLLNIVQVEHVSETLDHINALRGCFHQHRNAVFEDGDGGEDAEHGENEGANGVGQVVFGLAVDYYGSYHHTYALDDIANYVNECSSDVHVLMTMAMSSVSVTMSMTVIMTVIVRLVVSSQLWIRVIVMLVIVVIVLMVVVIVIVVVAMMMFMVVAMLMFMFVFMFVLFMLLVFMFVIMLLVIMVMFVVMLNLMVMFVVMLNLMVMFALLIMFVFTFLAMLMTLPWRVRWIRLRNLRQRHIDLRVLILLSHNLIVLKVENHLLSRLWLFFGCCIQCELTLRSLFTEMRNLGGPDVAEDGLVAMTESCSLILFHFAVVMAVVVMTVSAT